MEDAENTQPKDDPDGRPCVTVEATGQDSEDTSDTEVYVLTEVKGDFLIFHRGFVTIPKSNLIMACWILKRIGNKVNFSEKFKHIDFDLVWAVQDNER